MRLKTTNVLKFMKVSFKYSAIFPFSELGYQCKTTRFTTPQKKKNNK